MMRTIALLFSLMVFIVQGAVFAQNMPTTNPITADDIKPVIPQSQNMESAMSEIQTGEENSRGSLYLDEFKKLDVSYIGSTQNCVGYDIYAIKYRLSWFLAITVRNSPKLTVFIEQPPRSEEVLPRASDFAIEALNGILVNRYAKKKSRRRTVNDLELYGFYKLKRAGRKVAKGILYLEFPVDPDKEPDFFLFKMIQDIFKKKLPETPDPKSIKPELQKKIEAPIKELEKKVDSAIK